jgi:hypothetical protein
VPPSGPVGLSGIFVVAVRISRPLFFARFSQRGGPRVSLSDAADHRRRFAPARALRHQPREISSCTVRPLANRRPPIWNAPVAVGATPADRVARVSVMTSAAGRGQNGGDDDKTAATACASNPPHDATPAAEKQNRTNAPTPIIAHVVGVASEKSWTPCTRSRSVEPSPELPFGRQIRPAQALGEQLGIVPPAA